MTTLRELKTGALLHVLVALLIHGPSTNDELRRATGWSAEAIHDALDLLKRAPHELVMPVPNGRWATWTLTAHADQLFPNLWKMSPLAADSACSSSSLELDPPEESKLPLLPVSPLAADSTIADTLINQLTRLGATPDQAARAITAALKRRETTTQIATRITHLAQYARENRTIHNPGQWALDYIASGCALPEITHTGARDYSGYRPYLATGGDEAEE